MTTSKTERTPSKGAEIRESVNKRDRRFPRLMKFAEIASMPRLEFSKGCASAVFISMERDDARYYTQGLCFHDAAMEDLPFQSTSWDEAFLCLKGKLHVNVLDAEGNEYDVIVEEGDHFWAPAGYKYTLKATGVDSINFWTTAPLFGGGWRYTDDNQAPGYSEWLTSQRGETPPT